MKEYSKKDNDDWLYRIYVTDALKVIAGNTIGFVKEGRVMNKRYYELITPQEETQKDNRTAQEIANDVIGEITGK